MLSTKEIYELFVNRKDVYAIKTPAGFFVPVHKQFTMDKIQNHLNGDRNYGIYQLDVDNTVKWICIDVDDKEHFIQVKAIAEKAKASLKKRVFIEESNSGHHVWICFGEKVPAVSAFLLAVDLMQGMGIEKYEIFPKQTELNDTRKYGNLMNLPYAIHPKTGFQNKMTEV